MFNGATIFSNPVAILKKGKLIKINKCKKSWCKAEANDYKGWVKKNSLWGLL
jgi:SH3-like domain-containing protein